MALYPGGTWFDRETRGHSFAKNFLCDLMQSRALDGEPATFGAPLARIGTVAMLVGIAAFFVLVSHFERPPSRAARITRGAGLAACTIGLAVPLAQSDVHHDLHMVVVLSAFAPALVAACAAAWVSFRARASSRWVRVFAAITLASGAFDGLAYAYAYACAFAHSVPVQREVLYALLPGFQRIATMGTVGWIGAVCVRASRGNPSSSL